MTENETPTDVENFEADWDFEDTQQKQGPQETVVEGMGKAVVEFIDYGYIESYRKRNEVSAREGRDGGEDDGSTELSADQMAEIFVENFISPSFENLTGEKVKSMRPTVPANMLEALMGDDVDVTMNADGGATVGPAEDDAGNE